MQFPGNIYVDEALTTNDKIMFDSDRLIAFSISLHQQLSVAGVFHALTHILTQLYPLEGIKFNCNNNEMLWGKTHQFNHTTTFELNFSQAIIEFNFRPSLNSEKQISLAKLQTIYQLAFNNAAKFEQLNHQALFDALTHLGNRHFYQQSIQHALAKANRYQDELSLIIIDIDDFKQFNDHYGHNTGDEILTNFGQILSKTCRDSDQIFRIGGDEFAIIVRGDVHAAQQLCNRLKNTIEQDKMAMAFGVHCSMGIAQWYIGLSYDELFNQADKALYQVKANGKDDFKYFSQSNH